jgi:hypothetical protein
MKHRCINLGLPISGILYAWPFAKDGRAMRLRIEGPLILDSIELILESLLDGLALVGPGPAASGNRRRFVPNGLFASSAYPPGSAR